MTVKIDFKRLEELIEKKESTGRTIGTDEIATCVVGSRFTKDKTRSDIYYDCRELFREIPCEKRDDMCGRFYDKWKLYALHHSDN